MTQNAGLQLSRVPVCLWNAANANAAAIESSVTDGGKC